MTNSAVQAILTEYGDRVKCIKFAGGRIVVNCNLPEANLTTNDLELITLGGVDMIRYKQFDNFSHKYDTIIIPTSDVGKIVITENAKDPIDHYIV